MNNAYDDVIASSDADRGALFAETAARLGTAVQIQTRAGRRDILDVRSQVRVRDTDRAGADRCARAQQVAVDRGVARGREDRLEYVLVLQIDVRALAEQLHRTEVVRAGDIAGVQVLREAGKKVVADGARAVRDGSVHRRRAQSSCRRA
jgi:hypothetical protein